ncbi:protein-tyrosine kinase [Alistipes sp.]|uniref:protein-tyrosine kinase n=1 Tax=Alistipes sp. TaxID=1872444 RepID=UPI00259A8C58|nr:protein-tyrosine kinase [Alistipes sp.]HUN14429.1 protein-tyrosine kinase [Alistipes sp.]
MTTQPITIENGQVTIRPTAHGIWLTQSQIADLFGVFTATVSTNIRAILKSGVLHEDRIVRRTRCRNGNIVEQYSLEMVAALAFRLKSEKAEVFRRWIVERATTPAIVWKMPTRNDRVLN